MWTDITVTAVLDPKEYEFDSFVHLSIFRQLSPAVQNITTRTIFMVYDPLELLKLPITSETIAMVLRAYGTTPPLRVVMAVMRFQFENIKVDIAELHDLDLPALKLHYSKVLHTSSYADAIVHSKRVSMLNTEIVNRSRID